MTERQSPHMRYLLRGFSRPPTAGLEQRLVRSHFVIAAIGMALLAVGTVTTLVLRSNAIRLAQHRGPTARISLLVLSGTNRSIAGVRGWMLLGEPRFPDDVADAWQHDIRPALTELESLSQHSKNPQEILQRLEI